MAEINPPSWLDAGSYAAALDRRVLQSLVPSGGVAESGELAVTANGTPNMTVNVAAGTAFIVGSQQTRQGTYHVYNDATKNVSIATADGSNPRRDLVVAKVEDASVSGSTNAWSLAVVTGTPAASPADPEAPANSITLARVTVPAAATSISSGDITDLRSVLAFSERYNHASHLTAHSPLSRVGTGTTVLSTSEADVGGLSLTFTVPRIGMTYIATGQVLFVGSVTGWSWARSRFVMDGSSIPVSFHGVLADGTVGGGGASMVPLLALITGLSVGSHTLKIRGSKDNASGTVDVRGLESGFTLVGYG